jgi:hypothetical protein
MVLGEHENPQAGKLLPATRQVKDRVRLDRPAAAYVG